MATAGDVVVVGAGIAGIACARVLDRAGLRVRVLDRGRRLGGRMALRHERLGGVERVVDIGASYLTVSDPAFAAVVDGWHATGLARPWTDTLAVLPAAGGAARPAPGPVRWAAPGGLRSLVEDLATGLDVTSEHEVEQVDATPGEGAGGVAVDGEPVAGVVLAMPQPQASDLLPVPLADSAGSRGGARLVADADGVGRLGPAVVARARRRVRRRVRGDRPDRRRRPAPR